MRINLLRSLAWASAVLLACSGAAWADPPARVARLAYTSGAVSFSPAGETDWDRARTNRPLGAGDRLWTDAGARAEIELGGAQIRLGSATGVSVLQLDDHNLQLQLTQGTLNVRVRRLARGQVFEVDTPQIAFTISQPADYRIAVEPNGQASRVTVRQGQGEAYADGMVQPIDYRQAYRFSGNGLAGLEPINTPATDAFDRWAAAQDRNYDNSASARYVSPDVVGYQDLDANGRWLTDPDYGPVWLPERVAADWAPYRDGHWSWIDPWGWTWIDDAPWGYAVSHYGRWARLDNRWAWVPGPVRSQAYYAPALVAFVGGSNFQLSISTGNVPGVAWFPLAPREVYRPAYATSRGYYENINRSNTVINNTVINNSYSTTVINNTVINNTVYANRQVPGAVVAVPASIFAQSQPVARAIVALPHGPAQAATLTIAAPAAPTLLSVHGAAAPGQAPPVQVFERPVTVRSVPPPPRANFAVQQTQLALQPGHPLNDSARQALKPTAAQPAPVLRVITPPKDGQDQPPMQRNTPPLAAIERQPRDRPGALPAAPLPTPTAAPPVAVPVAVPVALPVAPPVAPQVAPPVLPPVLPPVAPPRSPALAPPAAPAQPAALPQVTPTPQPRPMPLQAPVPQDRPATVSDPRNRHEGRPGADERPQPASPANGVQRPSAPVFQPQPQLQPQPQPQPQVLREAPAPAPAQPARPSLPPAPQAAPTPAAPPPPARPSMPPAPPAAPTLAAPPQTARPMPPPAPNPAAVTLAVRPAPAPQTPPAAAPPAPPQANGPGARPAEPRPEHARARPDPDAQRRDDPARRQNLQP